DAGLEISLGDELLEGGDYRVAGGADVAREDTRRRQSSAGAKPAGQDRLAQRPVELAVQGLAAAIERQGTEHRAATGHAGTASHIGSLWKRQKDLLMVPVLWDRKDMNAPAAFPQTERTRVRRLPQRATYDVEAVHAILDAGLVCHVGFVEDGRPMVIPTAYARVGEVVVFHGS